MAERETLVEQDSVIEDDLIAFATREAASELSRLNAKVEELERKLFPYANAPDISGMSWNGFYLIGDEKSIKELRRIEHRSAQLEEFRKAFDERIAVEKARNADLSASLARAVEVKALVWRDQRGHAFPDMWDAKSVCGVYQIEERSASDSPAYVVTGPMYSFIADVDALESAKAAAQADFEQRIRSALVFSEQENRDACA